MITFKVQLVRTCLSILLLLTLSIDNRPAQAGDVLFLSGAEGGSGKSYNYYTFAAVVAPLFRNNLGDGFVQKYWVDVLGYDYPAGNQTINATAVGLEGALGYQLSGPNGWAAAYSGVRYSNTWLSPDNPGSRIRGSQTRAKFQLEGERILAADFKLNAIGSYVVESDSYWARGRGLYRMYREVYTGPEIIAHGDPDYRAWQFGWVFTGFEPVPKGSLGFKAGVRKIEKAETSGYFGVEFSKLF
jgi:hypothetical protein